MTESKIRDDDRVVSFDKYDDRGAYHWEECNPKARNFNPPLVARYQVVIKALGEIACKDRLLDVGCGDAYLLAQIQDQCGTAVGVDSEPIAVELANQILARYDNCYSVAGNCYALPFDDSHFDVVLLTDVIEHLTQPHDCLQEIARVLQPAGHLIVTTPKYRSDRMWDQRHEKEYTADEFKQLLSRYFDTVQVSYFWPLKWSNRYSTRLGWHACKYIARAGWNPFSKESTMHAEKYGQLKAVCRRSS